MEAGPKPTDDRLAYYDRIAPHHLAPLWEVIRNLLSRTPITSARPHLWDYATLRPLLLEAGTLISAAEAERRVLVMENPGLRGESRITETLYAGLQLILPGEIAPAHRHTPAALRFIVEGSGAYTAVEGEKTYMAPGDFVITPSWAWHDHGHDGDGPMVWLDGLDLPLIRFLGATFAEGHPDDRLPESRPPGSSLARYGANMRPVGDRFDRPHSPIFGYPYGPARDALTGLAGAGDPDPCLGYRLEYIDPLTGGPAMPTMSTFMTLLPKGFASARYRATDASVYSVVEGAGRTVVGDGGDRTVLAWRPKDHFVVPCWAPHVHEADAESVLFSYSDKVVQQKLGVWREDRP